MPFNSLHEHTTTRDDTKVKLQTKEMQNLRAILIIIITTICINIQITMIPRATMKVMELKGMAIATLVNVKNRVYMM